MLSFDCGCKIDINNFDIYNVNFECKKTWDMISLGIVRGVFQLDGYLGWVWSRKLLPNRLEELAALISLLRPGCLYALVDGKSMAQRYVDRKFGREENVSFLPGKYDVMEKTYNVLLYQEQLLFIASKIAGFDLKQADILRKAIGEKSPEIMSRIEKDFIDGCKKVGLVDEEKAKEIFSWMRESQKYSFNASHAFSYATLGYYTAYLKAHFPFEFFLSYFNGAVWKPDPIEEIQKLKEEATLFDISLEKPDFRDFPRCTKFYKKRKNVIGYGMFMINHVGNKVIDKIIELQKSNNVDIHYWYDILVNILVNINKRAATHLIMSGCFDTIGKGGRFFKLNEYNILKDIMSKTSKQMQPIKQKIFELVKAKKIDTLRNCLKYILTCSDLLNKRVITYIEDKLNILNDVRQFDSKQYIYNIETNKCYGIPITYSDLDVFCSNIKIKSKLSDIAFFKVNSGNFLCKVVFLKKKAFDGNKYHIITLQDNTYTLPDVIVPNRVVEKIKSGYKQGDFVLCKLNLHNNRIYCESIRSIH